MSSPFSSAARIARVAIPCVVAACLAPHEARAQSQCVFGEGTRSAQQTTLPNGRVIAYLSTPNLICNDGVRIVADSAVAYVSENYAQFLGDVRFRDDIRELESDEARYYTRQGRLQAEGSVVVRDPTQGTVIEHGDLLYLRRGDARFEEEITVRTGRDGMRPRMSVVPEAAPPGTDTATVAEPAEPAEPAGPPTPFLVESDRIELRGQGYFKAIGDVRIDRDSVVAFADSAEYTRGSGSMVLDGSARVETADSDLSGRRIDLVLAGGEMEAATARGEAVLVGRDVRLEAPEIRIYLTEGRMERVVAVPLSEVPGAPVAGASGAGTAASRTRIEVDSGGKPVRPVALTEEYRLVADSIDVRAPGEVLERIFAAGRARSESSARDSLNVEALPPLARQDWIEGDTVIAEFVQMRADTGAALFEVPDTARRRYELDRLTARVSARSLYRLPPADSTARAGRDAPAVHYVLADEIVVVMSAGEVDRMEVEGLQRGVHLEPMRARPAASDTAAVQGGGTPPDTGAVQGPDATPDPPAVQGPDATPDPPAAPAARRGSGPSGTLGTNFAQGPARTPRPPREAVTAVAHVTSRERQ